MGVVDKPPEHGARIIFDHVAHENSECGESAGTRGNHYGRNSQSLGQFAGMQAARATEGHKRKVARIVTAFDRDDAQGPLYVGIYDADNAGAELFEGQVCGLFFRASFLHAFSLRLALLQPFGGDATGSFDVERELASEKTVGAKAAEQQVGVGDGGDFAPAIADWAGIGAGRFGAHAQGAAAIEAGERSAAGADGVNLEHWDADGKAGDFGLAAGANTILHGGHVG